MPVPAPLRQLADQVGGTVDDTVRETTARWVAEWDRLEPVWREAITDIVAQYQATGSWPPPWQVARIDTAATAQTRTQQSLIVLVAEAAAAAGAAAGVVAAATVAAQPAAIAAQIAGAVVAPAPAALVAQELADRRARIAALHRPIAEAANNTIRYALTRPGPLPDDPATAAGRVLARIRVGFESGAAKIATIARTELADVYRSVAGMVDQANRRLFGEWQWVARLDRKTCPSCWVMHGSTHPVTQPGPWGHPGCRCMRLPIPRGTKPPDASARFARLPHADQLAVMGPARLALLRSGRIGWDDLAVRRTTNGWRPSYQTRTVRDLQNLADRAA